MNWFPEDLVSAYADTLLAEQPNPPRTVSVARLLRANIYLALILLAFPAFVTVVAVLFSGGRSPLPFVLFAVGFAALIVTVFGQSVYSASDALQRGVAAIGHVVRIDPAYRSTVAVIRVDVAGVGTESQVPRSGASSTLYAGDTVQVLIDPATNQVMLIIGILEPAASPAQPAWVTGQDKINAVAFTTVGALSVIAAIVILVFSWRISTEHDAHDAAAACSAPNQALSGTGCRWVGQAQVVRKYADNSSPRVDLAFDGLSGETFTATFGTGQSDDLAGVQEGQGTTAELWQGMVIEVGGVPSSNDVLLRQPGNLWELSIFFGVLGLIVLGAGLYYGRKAWGWGPRHRTVSSASTSPSPSAP